MYCFDGPFRGVQYLDIDTGRVMFTDNVHAARCFYRLIDGQTTTTAIGTLPTAYVDRYTLRDGATA